MAIDRVNRDIEDKAPRFYPIEDGFTAQCLEYILEDKKKRDKREYVLRVPAKGLITLANRRIVEIQQEFGSDPAFRKYFGTADYSDRGPNTVYIQLGLVAPRNPNLEIEIREYVFKNKEQVLEDVKVHPLYDEIEALEEMCMAFYKPSEAKAKGKAAVM